MVLWIEQLTKYNRATNAIQHQVFYCVLAASMQIIFFFYFFFFLVAVCATKSHFAALLQPAIPGVEPESQSGCYAAGMGILLSPPRTPFFVFLFYKDLNLQILDTVVKFNLKTKIYSIL